MYAFVAKNDVQAKALEKNGAVWMPSMGVWIGRDFSSWKLRRLKKKGLVPKATGFPMKTTKPPLKWPRWIKIITLGPPVAMFLLVIFMSLQKSSTDTLFAGFMLAFIISAFWSVFVNGLSKLAYAFYQRLRGDQSYWKYATNKQNRSRNDYNIDNMSICSTYIKIPGNIGYNN